MGAHAYKPMMDAEDVATDATNGVSTGYRRARAGTMPSNLQHVASRLTPEADDMEQPASATTATSPTPTNAAYARTSALSPAYPQQTTASRPALRHTASSAANLETPVAAAPSRLRSGSLTLPGAGLGDAFGHGPFSNAWLSNPGLTTAATTPARSPLGQRMQPPEGAFSSYTSPSESAGSLGTDDLNFSTLDYLGLADVSDHLPPASMSELRSQTQRAIASSGPASRLRASTVSNFARPFRASVTSIHSFAQEANPYENGQNEEEVLSRAIENLGVYEPPYMSNPQLANLYAPTNLFKDNHRQRASTIGALENPQRRGLNRSASYLASIPQSPIQNELAAFGAYGYVARSRDSSRAGRLSISSHTSRTGTPEDKGSSTPQVPTRSLWIGNLDVNATSSALLHVFAPYGAIESVRMLPEKTCAFVNFMDKVDAIRARDDVLNRLGGHVSALSETAPVRIGFGKIDSAPNGPSVSTVAPAPPGLVFTSGPPPPLPTTPIAPMSSAPPPSAAPGPPGVPVTIPSQTATNMISSPDQNDHTSALPTRALWIGSIPSTTSASTLLQIFSPFGPVESSRVLQNKCCGFINFERLDSAVSARNALNGRDILGSDVGPIRIGFARVPTRSPTISTAHPGLPASPSDSPTKLGVALNTVLGAASVSTEQQMSVEGGGLENYRSPLVLDLVKQGVHEQVLEKGLAGENGNVSDQQMIMQVLSSQPDEDSDIKAAADHRPPAAYYTAIPPLPDRSMRRFDTGKLKDVRKKLDSGQCRQDEIDEITKDLMNDCAELASDFIGNTIIQKLFERTSHALRIAMLERIAPHLATIGVHKNGTWAAQKIIECSSTDEERAIVVNNLRPFAPPLMCDSLGNYVCAGTLRFGEPFNHYVFDAMIDRMWDIAQNRFGARCMRTCLESPYTSLYQKKRISTSIILNSIPLATNPNGALLLTWLVDSSNLPGRYSLLANRFIPHIAHLCTHKLASLTVLRIITQTTEPQASTNLVQAIFTSTNDQTLVEILSDANNGNQVIGKIIAVNTIAEDLKKQMVEAVRRVLPNIKASTTPPYRMLLEAVGLPVPAGYVTDSPFGRNPNPHWQPNRQQQQQQQQPQFGQTYYPYHQSVNDAGYQAVNGLDNLSPLLIPQTMPLGQMRGNHQQGKSPRTPTARQGRLSPGSMMSPASDPFNPFASPSVDLQYPSQGGLRMGSTLSQPPVTFEQQPAVGGLGMGGQGQGGGMMYYGQQSSGW
ncbi:pumilio domain-containing protein c [Cryptococcus bacillisporus CA1873]|uniref:Pumilio domain-containing protein c n=1 Tax=Cryptococcus bacillisporus CA1873 TaxID=1296111 RepID=A0ABR5BHU6_CRYGA|nr:pumilio domain-containing protein c [Cryptococcus bacillisporus CA1873]|eukprot:KIR68730.1 pumilio domain-containing protein c [Cryptococcus gattii CA1873]